MQLRHSLGVAEETHEHLSIFDATLEIPLRDRKMIMLNFNSTAHKTRHFKQRIGRFNVSVFMRLTEHNALRNFRNMVYLLCSV
jgi:hypothetical protein